MNSPVNLRAAVQNLDTLPALPVIAQKILAVDTGTDAGEVELLRLIEQDPQISARLISLANSPAMGASRRLSTVKEATMLLGLRKIKSVAIAMATMSLRKQGSTGKLDLQHLWLHNLGVAFAMQSIARAMPRAMRPADDVVFLAGMMHDIGYLALAHLDPQRSDELHTYLAAKSQRPALEIERSVVDMTHDELGGELARHWRLPEEIVLVIRFHHTPDLVPAQANQPLVRMAYIAEKLLTSYGMAEYVEPGVKDADWEALGIDPAMAEELLLQVSEQGEQAALFAASFA